MRGTSLSDGIRLLVDFRIALSFSWPFLGPRGQSPQNSKDLTLQWGSYAIAAGHFGATPVLTGRSALRRKYPARPRLQSGGDFFWFIRCRSRGSGGGKGYDRRGTGARSFGSEEEEAYRGRQP